METFTWKQCRLLKLNTEKYWRYKGRKLIDYAQPIGKNFNDDYIFSVDQTIERNEYEKRNNHLSSMGFETYKEYRESWIWQNIRSEVLIRDDYKCRLCGKQAQEVHHLRYDIPTLEGRTLRWLISCCHSCHHQIEISNTNKKLSFIESFDNYKFLNNNSIYVKNNKIIMLEKKNIKRKNKKWNYKNKGMLHEKEDLVNNIFK